MTARTLPIGLADKLRQEQLGELVGRTWKHLDLNSQDAILAKLDLSERLALIYWQCREIKDNRESEQNN